MARKSRTQTTLFFLLISLIAFLAFVPVFAPLPSLSSHYSLSPRRHHHRKVVISTVAVTCITVAFFLRLVRAKAMGLNTIQTYVPWNLHDPQPGKLVFEGIADLVSFLKLCDKLDMLVILRPGPYICGEWDLRGFPAWLLAIEPPLILRSSDPAYLRLVDNWWGILLPKVAPFLYNNGGPIIMVQIENEFGSYGDDKAYLHHLVKVARTHLGDDIILVIGLHTAASLPSVPSDNGKTGYGHIQLQKTAFLFDFLDVINPADVVESENPLPMESVGQMFGFLLYVSEYTLKDDKSVLLIPEVHDRAQVFTVCHSEDSSRRPTHVGSIDRLSSKKLGLPNAKCASNISLFVLVPDHHVSHEKITDGFALASSASSTLKLK